MASSSCLREILDYFELALDVELKLTFILEISVASKAEPVSENIFVFGITLSVFISKIQ